MVTVIFTYWRNQKKAKDDGVGLEVNYIHWNFSFTELPGKDWSWMAFGFPASQVCLPCSFALPSADCACRNTQGEVPSLLHGSPSGTWALFGYCTSSLFQALPLLIQLGWPRQPQVVRAVCGEGSVSNSTEDCIWFNLLGQGIKNLISIECNNISHLLSMDPRLALHNFVSFPHLILI